jgi:hypothetical protein
VLLAGLGPRLYSAMRLISLRYWSCRKPLSLLQRSAEDSQSCDRNVRVGVVGWDKAGLVLTLRNVNKTNTTRATGQAMNKKSFRKP